jgi:L-seryl-tRNA(Ser) seleniumtransferase
MLDRLGLQSVINASGPVTRLGGHRLDPEVVEAMAAAAQAHVPIEALQAWAGGIIADATGAEAGCVTAGASSGLLLAAAAVIAGRDPVRMDTLPATEAFPHEIVVHRLHRNAYDHALRAAGAELVEIGYGGYPGAGRTLAWQLEAAITERTVAVAYPILRSTPGVLSLPAVVAIAHAHGLPVIVDAAAALPPASNLRAFVAAGADLVTFSGGKAIRGPQASGILCGRRDLVEAALLQATDLDVPPLLWAERAPGDGSSAPASHGIGRSAKVGKEAIVGLIVALQRFIALDERAATAELEERCRLGARILDGAPGAVVRVRSTEERGRALPIVEVELQGEDAVARCVRVVISLQQGKPAIHLSHNGVDEAIATIVPTTLDDDEMRLVAERLRDELARDA